MSRTGQVDVESQRVPLERTVVLKFDRFSTFINDYSANISLGGMFVRTSRVQPAGSKFEFVFKLADDSSLIQGTGEVVWVREEDQGADRPAGMGLRFLELDWQSRKLVFEVIDGHIQSGGTPFNLERRGLEPTDSERRFAEASGPRESGPVPTVGPPSRAMAGDGPGWLPPERAKSSPALWVAALATAGIVVTLALSWPGDRSSVTRPSAVETRPGAVEVSADPPAPVAAAPAEPDRVVSDLAIETVENWAAAWSAQDVERYLAAYGTDFEPPRGLDRAQWEASRQVRISRPASIAVEIDAPEVEIFSEDRVQVMFLQRYRSDTYSDEVTKLMELTRGAEGWKITSETVVP